MKGGLFFLLLPLFAWGGERYEVSSQGHRWTVHGWAPERAGKKPLVVVLHGAGGDGRGYLEKNGWLAEAERGGFIVVAPDGLPVRPGEATNFLRNPRVWNAGNLRAGSARTRVDDVVFVGALLDDAERRWEVDRRRVYVTGHSNGGAMAFLLAARMGGRIAAIAPVATLPYLEEKPIRPAVPTMYFLGRLDPLVPFAGGESVLPWGRRRTEPVERGIARWARGLGCPAEPVAKVLEKGVERRRYCAAFGVVIVEGQGHGWPGGRESGLGERVVGPAVSTVDATKEIWRFFAQHQSYGIDE